MAIERYRKFIQEGKGQRPTIAVGAHTKSGISWQRQLCGKMQLWLDGEQDLSEVPLAQKKATAETIEHLRSNQSHRNTAIVKAYRVVSITR